MDEKFLHRVARYFVERATKDNLADYVFVMSNRRSGLFMKEHFKQLLAKSPIPVMMPRFHTLQRVISDLSQSVMMSRDEQLFLLYDCYKEVLAELNEEEEPRDFDRFVFWADIILNDFNDADASLAEVSKLFRNLKGYKEIAADFLTDEQKEIVRRLWGDSYFTRRNGDSFWLHIKSDDEGKNLSHKFVHLWELLLPLYERFTTRLKKLGYVTEGLQQRLATEAVRDLNRPHHNRHYVFVGISAVTHAEFMVMDRLKQQGSATFFWDDKTIKAPDRFATSGLPFLPQLKYIANLRKQFGMPEDFEELEASWPQSIECISLPSNTGQAKYLRTLLLNWFPDGQKTDDAALLDTAVVMPDEGLLVPALLSLPDSIHTLNVSMRLPFSSTPFASLLAAIINMQLRARKIHDEYHFYYEDVERVLSHTHIRTISPVKSQEILEVLKSNKLFNVAPDDLDSMAPELAYIFTPVKNLNSVDEIHDYLSHLFIGLREAFEKLSTNRDLIEYRMIDYFEENIRNLYLLIQKYEVTMKESTFFRLFERMLNAKQIEVMGSPLCGLQMLGVLETRVLDFKRLVILSMNEKVFPRKTYLRTIIPTALRRAFGMRTPDEAEAEYAYYFYRMLSGADEVKIVHDSRSAAFGVDEPSRYITQLKLLYDRENITFKDIEFNATIGGERTLVVDKHKPEVARALARFTAGGDQSLSASALKSYKACSFKFYLQTIRRIMDQNEVNDFIDAAEYGTIVHAVLEKLYKPYKTQLITADIIKSMMNDDSRLIRLIEETILETITARSGKYTLKSRRKLNTEGQLTARIIRLYVKCTLELEIEQFCETPFRYIKSEMRVDKPAWKISDDLSVNFKMFIDRVDEIYPGKLRFIDYKTGSDTIELKGDLENLFTTGNYDAIFQLLVYCEAYAAMVDPSVDIQPVIYSFNEMLSRHEIANISIKGMELISYRQFTQAFRPMLIELFEEIFDKDIPFIQTEDIDKCKYCQFTTLCNRETQKIDD